MFVRGAACSNMGCGMRSVDKSERNSIFQGKTLVLGVSKKHLRTTGCPCNCMREGVRERKDRKERFPEHGECAAEKTGHERQTGISREEYLFKREEDLGRKRGGKCFSIYTVILMLFQYFHAHPHPWNLLPQTVSRISSFSKEINLAKNVCVDRQQARISNFRGFISIVSHHVFGKERRARFK